MSQIQQNNLLQQPQPMIVGSKFDNLSLIVTPNDKKQSGSPKNQQLGSPLLSQGLTPAQKKFLDEYYQNNQVEKGLSSSQLGAIMNGPRSPLQTSSMVIQSNQLARVAPVYAAKKDALPQVNQGSNSFTNLSMRNANKTINILHKDSNLRTSRESLGNNYITNNVNRDSLNKHKLIVAQKLRFSQSKSPPQHNMQAMQQSEYSQHHLPNIKQRIVVNNSILKKRKSLDQINNSVATDQQNGAITDFNMQDYLNNHNQDSDTSDQDPYQMGPRRDNYINQQENNQHLGNISSSDQLKQSTISNSSPNTTSTATTTTTTNLQNFHMIPSRQVRKIDQRHLKLALPTQNPHSTRDNSVGKKTNNSSTITNDQKTSHRMAPANTFNPNLVKLKLKSAPSDPISHEIALDKQWLRMNIPHISGVIKDVKDDEGVEITINCNIDSFRWIIEYLQFDDLERSIALVNDQNCLNLVVSSLFLGLDELYLKLWRMYLQDHFVRVIDSCTLNLKNMSHRIVGDIAKNIDIAQIKQLQPRKDKFISQLYKTVVEQMIETNNIQACFQCNQIMTDQNMRKTQCRTLKPDAKSIVSAYGDILVSHEIDKNFDGDQFIKKFRDKYRICWQEIYEKFRAIVYPAQYCEQCDTWFTLNQIGDCRSHPYKALKNMGTSEMMYTCCMKVQQNFNPSLQVLQDGCNMDFHQPSFQSDQQRDDFEEFKKNLPLVSESQEITQKIQALHSNQYAFAKPMSFNYWVPISKAYMESSLIPQADPSIRPKPDIMDDLLFRTPEAADQIFVIQNDQLIREQISRQAKQLVRSRSPQQSSQTIKTLIGNQIRVTLDVDTNQIAIVQTKKRSLSPQQIKEVQIITKKKLGECRTEIVREDDIRSMKLITQILRQQRASDNEADHIVKLEPRIISISRDKTPQTYSSFIDFDRVNDLKIIKSSKEILNTRRSNNSQERRKKSPHMVIRADQIIRKASPH
ncbi:UNKNOWN [Stylonychia lemnae]|uniref:SANT and BTB domain-containing protein n=1 Tax=Stylonychia lemnae TaxID=5949 RepID=A0A078A954_STYLE|nr:UNKNOWN [Stylonychia lemnae]|eukprot:CDW78097.1 UNKNOWN [Stylonychia lemnae]